MIGLRPNFIIQNRIINDFFPLVLNSNSKLITSRCHSSVLTVISRRFPVYKTCCAPHKFIISKLKISNKIFSGENSFFSKEFFVKSHFKQRVRPGVEPFLFYGFFKKYYLFYMRIFLYFSIKKIFLTHKPQKSWQYFQLTWNKQHNNLIRLQSATAIFQCWKLYNFGKPLKK